MLKIKIILALDAYKGSLTQIDAIKVMKSAIQDVFPYADIVEMPMADGGEGTLDVISYAMPSVEKVPICVTGPHGKKIDTSMGVMNEETALIEIAKIAGLTHVPEQNRNPLNMTTYGIGEAIQIALDSGIRKFIIALGGSATNDGGIGMLLALGADIRDKVKQMISKYGKGLLTIKSVNIDPVMDRLGTCTFQIATDVTNPLLGKQGASEVYGPQKGATAEQIKSLDEGLANFCHVMEQSYPHFINIHKQSGTGAAGGLGYAFRLLGGRQYSGASLIGEMMGLGGEIQDADLVITGEGKSDAQTLLGKVPFYVAKLANMHGKQVCLVSGTIEGRENIQDYYTRLYELKNESMSVKQAMEQAESLLYNQTRQMIVDFIEGRNETC
ncbi:glycerate kinase [Virgibacillus soli]